jgi:signal transduction histidine kinase
MCGQGTLWRLDGVDALAALKQRTSFMEVVSNHDGWQLDEDAARNIFTELLSNVIRHGASPVSLALECEGVDVNFRLAESGRGFDKAIGLPPMTSEHGRGLFVVSQMAERLDVDGNPRGTKIVATLPRIAQRRESGPSG